MPIKSINGVPWAGIKSRNGIPVAGIKSVNGLEAGSGATDPDAEAFFASIASRAVTISDPDKERITAFYIAAKAAGVYADIGSLVVDGLVDSSYSEGDRKKIVLTDMIDPSKVSTIVDDYAGSHIAGVGFEGNLSMAILHEFNAGTNAKWSQNSASMGLLLIRKDSGTRTNPYEIFSSDAGFANWNCFLRSKEGAAFAYLNTNAAAAYTYDAFLSTAPAWWRVVRTGTANTRTYVNGVLAQIDIRDSVAPASQKTGRFNAYFGSWGGVDFATDSIQAALYFGNSALDCDALESIINDTLLAPLAAKPYLDKSLVTVGDSIFCGMYLGHHSRMQNKTVEDLNDHWTAAVTNEPSKTAANINTDFATYQAPYFRTTFAKNVCHIACGTNDLGYGTRNGTTVYDEIVAIATQAKDAGWTVIIGGIIANNVTGYGGPDQATFDAERAICNDLFLADFDTPTDIPNYYTSSSVSYADGYIDAYADPNFADYTNATYFEGDQRHLTAVGLEYYSTAFMQPVLASL